MEAVHRIGLGQGWGEKMLQRALHHCLSVNGVGNRVTAVLGGGLQPLGKGSLGGSFLKVVSSSKKPSLN